MKGIRRKGVKTRKGMRRSVDHTDAVICCCLTLTTCGPDSQWAWWCFQVQARAGSEYRAKTMPSHREKKAFGPASSESATLLILLQQTYNFRFFFFPNSFVRAGWLSHFAVSCLPDPQPHFRVDWLRNALSKNTVSVAATGTIALKGRLIIKVFL